ncbi:HWE histidine kinase domain-containing protein [Limimaricola soesokkakensis]|uniref:PAS domain-containing sensor histidine kinase n=1 Tax=Alphaproteobacteria TaxID=28211 RepID=UPI003517F19F
MMAKGASEERLETLAELVEDAPCGMVITDPHGRLRYVNEALSRWLALPARAQDRPAQLPELMTLPGQLFYETHLGPMMRLQGFAREIACSLKVEGGPPLPVLITGVARYDAAGDPVRFDYTIFDARERRAYEDELRRTRRKAEELAAIVRTSPNAILSVDSTGCISSWNASAEHLLGYHFEVTVAPIQEQEQTPSSRGYSVVLRDISKRKRAERRLHLALDEMKHRVKNTLAVVAGIARQTLPADMRSGFVARLHALSRAHDALAEQDQEGADLRDLLAFTAEEAGGHERFRITGPSVLLPPHQVTSLLMALHELATNAIKYGSLSAPEGHVLVEYDRERHDTGQIRLVWQEFNGPPVAPPTRQGFGSKMINSVIKAELSAKVHFDYRPDGVRCEIVFTPGTAE